MNVPFAAPRLIVGLLGGIASGKSSISAIIVRLTGARVVDADALAKVALEECAKDGRLVGVLGPKALKADGTPDRKAIAARVFKEARALRDLERLTHPFVLARIDEAVEEHRSGRGPSLLVLDVPLLLETGLERSCDSLWFVEVPDAERFARAEKRLGLSEADVRAREEAQSPLDRKRARADLIVDNAGTPESTEAQVVRGLSTIGARLRGA